tara:strand:+ start:202 stop:312 length:111 start_codon:yes stop_codon:yes gene_type:complete
MGSGEILRAMAFFSFWEFHMGKPGLGREEEGGPSES